MWGERQGRLPGCRADDGRAEADLGPGRRPLHRKAGLLEGGADLDRTGAPEEGGHEARQAGPEALDEPGRRSETDDHQATVVSKTF